jgi:hypothetical protein
MRPFNPRSLRVAALAFVAASLYACSSDSPTSPGDAQPPELTAVLSEATQPSLGEIGAIVAPTSRLVSALAPSLSTPVPSNCGYDGTSQSFVCARVTYNGLTVEHSFTLFDAAGNRQSQFSPGSTASVQTRSHVTGTLTLPTGSTTMDAVDDRLDLPDERYLRGSVGIGTDLLVADDEQHEHGEDREPSAPLGGQPVARAGYGDDGRDELVGRAAGNDVAHGDDVQRHEVRHGLVHLRRLLEQQHAGPLEPGGLVRGDRMHAVRPRSGR